MTEYEEAEAELKELLSKLNPEEREPANPLDEVLKKLDVQDYITEEIRKLRAQKEELLRNHTALVKRRIMRERGWSDPTTGPFSQLVSFSS